MSLTKKMSEIASKVLSLSANTPNDADLGREVRKLITNTFKKEDELENVQGRSEENIRK